jgi:hypothetical protein
MTAGPLQRTIFPSDSHLAESAILADKTQFDCPARKRESLIAKRSVAPLLVSKMASYFPASQGTPAQIAPLCALPIVVRSIFSSAVTNEDMRRR